MRKAFLSLVAGLCLACSCMPALAESRRFEGLSLAAPEGWEVQESGSRLMLISPGQTCVVSIQLGDSGGMDEKLMAGEMSQILKGTAPEALGESGGCAFNAEVAGVASHIRVRSGKDKYLLFSVAGDQAAHAAEVEAIWRGLEENGNTLQELLAK